MSFENPLDKIKKIKEEKLAKKQEDIEILKEKKLSKQEDIDSEYELAISENKELLNKITQIKDRVSEIHGTQEDMIKQYRNTIDEVLKPKDDETDIERESRLETLDYLRNNFREIFGDGIKEWRALGLKKTKILEEKKLVENLSKDNNEKIESLYPKTTIGLEEIKNKELEDLSNLFEKLKLETYLFSKYPYRNRTFKKIREKLDISEIKELLNLKQELVNGNKLFTKKYEQISFNKWQDAQLEDFLVSVNDIKSEYNEKFIEKFKKDYNYKISEIEDIKIVKSRIGESQIDIKTIDGFEKFSLDRDKIHSEIEELEKEIKNKENSFLKKGLKNLKKRKEVLKEEYTQVNKAVNEFYEIRSFLEKKINNLLREHDIRDIGYLKNLNNIKFGSFINEFQKDRSFTEEQKEFLEREETIRDRIKEIEKKI